MTFHNTQGDALGYVLDGISGYSTHVFHELPKLELVIKMSVSLVLFECLLIITTASRCCELDVAAYCTAVDKFHELEAMNRGQIKRESRPPGFELPFWPLKKIRSRNGNDAASILG